MRHQAVLHQAWLCLLGRMRRKPDGRGRVLVIDDFLPDPLIGAGAPRAFELLRALLATGMTVTHCPTLVPTAPSSDIRSSLSAVDFRKGGSPQALRKFLNQRHGAFDVIFVSRPHNLVFFNEACASNPRIGRSSFIIYDSEAIFAEREVRQQRVLKTPPLDVTDKLRAEIAQARGVDMVITVNEHDATQFRDAGHDDVLVLRHSIRPAFGHASHHVRDEMLFVGPTYSDDTPNSDAVVWFVDQVLPAIRAGLKRDIALSLVGRSTAPAIAQRIDGRILHHGALQDLDDVYGRARVFVAPTRYAAGVPLKVYDAAAHGVPCVVTPLLAEQLGWKHDRELLVAETPDDFARQCICLYDDAALWDRLRQAAFARVTAECDAAHFDRDVASICDRALRGSRRLRSGAISATPGK